MVSQQVGTEHNRTHGSVRRLVHVKPTKTCDQTRNGPVTLSFTSTLLDCFSRVHLSFVNVVFSCSARDLPDNIPRVTDEENVLFEAMNQKEREAFVRQRLAEYRVELAREREMLNGMTDEERKAWVDAHWSSSVMWNGRILEVQLQSEWTSDTDADIKAAAFAWSKLSSAKAQGMIKSANSPGNCQQRSHMHRCCSLHARNGSRMRCPKYATRKSSTQKTWTSP